uniref:G_PROTEIN_RECEP_F1_2 domain-containing protein n=1 Tax=Steinernema glaseri TaxID=37863 RepID=A0A1I7ZRE7_9BILA
MNFSFRPEALPFLGGLAMYMTSYVAASIYLMLKLGQAIKMRTSSTASETVRLVKTVRRNCLCLVVIFVVTDVVPGFVLLGSFSLLGADNVRPVVTVVVRYVCISCSSYSWITTVVMIIITKPYREKTMQMLRSLSTTMNN